MEYSFCLAHYALCLKKQLKGIKIPGIVFETDIKFLQKIFPRIPANTNSVFNPSVYAFAIG